MASVIDNIALIDALASASLAVLVSLISFAFIDAVVLVNSTILIASRAFLAFNLITVNAVIRLFITSSFL